MPTRHIWLPRHQQISNPFATDRQVVSKFCCYRQSFHCHPSRDKLLSPAGNQKVEGTLPCCSPTAPTRRHQSRVPEPLTAGTPSVLNHPVQPKLELNPAPWSSARPAERTDTPGAYQPCEEYTQTGPVALAPTEKGARERTGEGGQVTSSSFHSEKSILKEGRENCWLTPLL